MTAKKKTKKAPAKEELPQEEVQAEEEKKVEDQEAVDSEESEAEDAEAEKAKAEKEAHIARTKKVAQNFKVQSPALKKPQDWGEMVEVEGLKHCHMKSGVVEPGKKCMIAKYEKEKVEKNDLRFKAEPFWK